MELVDTTDLKSVEHNVRAGSIPAPATIFMFMIDGNRLFGLFGDEDKTPEEISADSKGFSDEIKESPTWKVNMFKKIVANHINFQEKIAKFFKNKNREWSDEEGKEHADLVVYNRAWHYIKDVDIDNKHYVFELLSQDPYEFSLCLQLALKYFEKFEKYEKCAHLHSIIKFIEEIFQDSLD